MLYNVVDLAGKLTLIHQNRAIIILHVLQFMLGDVKVHVTCVFPQISSVNAVQNRAGVNSGIGIDTNSNSNWKGIE